MIAGRHRVVRHGIRVEFQLGADNDPESVENVDAVIEMPNGDRWGATLLTVREIERLLARWRRSGESAEGSYLRVPDLIVMNSPGVEAMAVAIFDMIDRGEQTMLTPIEPTDCTDFGLGYDAARRVDDE